jgi:DNA-directed RNA polymerase I, II, and III subunit RPABC2
MSKVEQKKKPNGINEIREIVESVDENNEADAVDGDGDDTVLDDEKKANNDDDDDDPIERDSDYEDGSDDEHEIDENENLADSNYSRIIKIVPSDMRQTSNVMMEYEYSDTIGIRATQIENGAPVYTDIGELTNPLEIAAKEMFDRRCPLFIKRYIDETTAEHWNCREMAFPANIRSNF